MPLRNKEAAKQHLQGSTATLRAHYRESDHVFERRHNPKIQQSGTGQILAMQLSDAGK